MQTDNINVISSTRKLLVGELLLQTNMLPQYNPVEYETKRVINVAV